MDNNFDGYPQQLTRPNCAKRHANKDECSFCGFGMICCGEKEIDVNGRCPECSSPWTISLESAPISIGNFTQGTLLITESKFAVFFQDYYALVFQTDYGDLRISADLFGEDRDRLWKAFHSEESIVWDKIPLSQAAIHDKGPHGNSLPYAS
jgi:hypothetical protein